MVEALLGELRRSQVLGLRPDDLRPGERRVFIADGKAGHQRLVPMSPPVSAQAGFSPRPVGKHTPGGCENALDV